MRSPKPAIGGAGSGGPLDAGGGNPAPRPMAPERPAGTQMFSGMQSRPTGFAPGGGAAPFGGMRSPTSFAGTRVTPFERYRAQASGPDQMNQQEFWQSGQAPQYAASNVIRSALGMDPAAHPLVADALRRKRMQAGPAVGGMGGYGSGTFAPQPRPRPMGPPVTLPGGGGPSILGAPTGTYQVPMPEWAATPPSIQPMPPVALGQNDPRLTVLR